MVAFKRVSFLVVVALTTQREIHIFNVQGSKTAESRILKTDLVLIKKSVSHLSHVI